MVHSRMNAFSLILISIYNCHAFEWSGPPRTMAKAMDIESNVLQEYLSFLDCQTLDEFDIWLEYTAICMQNTSCVGARSNPPHAICTRSAVQREGPVQIEDLWLIISDIKEYGEPLCATTYDLISSPEFGIPDEALTASSAYVLFFAHMSRITSDWGWSPSTNAGAWIRADLGENRIVVAIRMRGSLEYFVTQFEISISNNGVEWSDVVDDSGYAVVFEGNTDGSTIVSTLMPTLIETRFVQLNVVSFSGNGPLLRWAIDGCAV